MPDKLFTSHIAITAFISFFTVTIFGINFKKFIFRRVCFLAIYGSGAHQNNIAILLAAMPWGYQPG
ncbi:hypothetical protein BH23BAC2_BH23BAC2_01730 [soil metagenome]